MVLKMLKTIARSVFSLEWPNATAKMKAVSADLVLFFYAFFKCYSHLNFHIFGRLLF